MVNVTLNTKTRSCIASTTFLGYEGENNANKLIFIFDDLFVDGFAQINIKRENESGYVNLTKVEETYELEVKASLVSQIGDVTFQLQITKTDGTIYKYDAFVMTVKDAIDTDTPMPEEYPSWIEEANVKLAEMDEAIKDAEKLSAKVEPTENGALITITDKDGTTTAEILNGSGGSGEGGTTNYSELVNKPKINNVELIGNKTLDQLGIQPKGNYLTSFTEKDPTVPNWAKQSTKPSYTKTEVGLGNVDNVKQYSVSNPPPYPVTSVNGKTGAVSIEIPTVPTKTSQLTNDSGYVKESDIPTKASDVGAIAEPSAEGTAGQVLTTDGAGNRFWSTVSGGGGGEGGTSNYLDLINKPRINSIELTGNKSLDDLGIQAKGNYLTEETEPKYTADKPNIALKSEMPTNLSDLVNDIGYITDYTETDPTVPDIVKTITEADINNWNNKAETSDIPDISTKQDTLVSGTNIKTINGESILGEGNITIEGGSGGDITIDTEMSDTSENAVQNKVIKAYVDDNIPKLVTLSQTEYDALVSAGTVDDNTYYFILEETEV